MNSRYTRKRCLLALTACLSSGRALAQDGEILCGTPDDLAAPLAKTADLPKITKVWSGTLKALVIRIAFSDAPYTVDTATISKTNSTINTLYRAMSRNTFEWDWH